MKYLYNKSIKGWKKKKKKKKEVKSIVCSVGSTSKPVGDMDTH